MASKYSKQIVLLGWIYLLLITSIECFEVTPQYEEVITKEDDIAIFNYIIRPWPPPYDVVDLSFWSDIGDTPTELCQVRYTEGDYDEDTGNCSLWEPRMLPYDPATPNGVYFSFEPVYWDDRGRYMLRIQYEEPDIITPVNLTVHVDPSAPNITTDPDKHAYLEGDMVSLICKINHVYPPADLQWTRGMFDVIHPSPEDYHKANDYYDFSTSTIRFRVQQSDHGQAYVCSAYVDVNTQQYTASGSLNVHYAPAVTLSPCQTGTTYYVPERENAHFTCVINANPHYQDIHWHRKLEDDFVDISNTNELDLTLVRVLRNDSSTFKCSTSNNIGPGESQCVMEVQYGPTVDIPSELEVEEHLSVDLECQADSNPAPNHFYWMTGTGQVIQEGKRFNITSAAPHHTGKYTCEVRNTLTPTNKPEQIHTGRATMDLRVLFAPRLQQYSLTKFAGHNGQPVVLVCDVYAYPMVNILWKRNGQPISSDQYRNISQNGNTGFVHIYSVRDPDYGNYECNAHNDQGSKQTQLQLLHPGSPDGPQNCTVHNTTDFYTSLVCVPGYDGGEEIFTHVEAMDEHGRQNVLPSKVTWSPDRSHMIVTVSDLDPLTGYSLHVFAENRHGRSSGYFTVHVKTEDGPGNPDPPSENGPSVGLIIGATMSLLLLVGIIIVVAMVVLWRVGLEPACARKAQDRANMPYTTTLLRDEGKDGYQNQAYEIENKKKGAAKRASCLTRTLWSLAYEIEDNKRTSAVSNEYSAVPGMVKQGIPLTDMSRDNKTNEAYEQRKQQSHLAGMGALSYNSTHNLPHTLSHQQQTQLTKRPKPGTARRTRPATIGGPAQDHWEYPRDKLDMKKKMGEGAFGEVWKCTAKEIQVGTGSLVVAVKFVRENRPVEEQQAFQKELIIMKSLGGHPNIIALMGCCTTSEPMYIILEYAENGNLQTYMREQRDDVEYDNIQDAKKVLDTRALTIFALQVASGMEYISSIGYLHRDLAARNVLVTSDLTCKICDFGLARDIITCRMYESKTQRRLPIRWMSPESLFDSVYTTQSDVWSFGVLLWEILTLGSTPYPGLSGPEIMELIRTGYRMDKPQHCTKQMYSIMRGCWQHSARDRPDFSSIRQNLECIIHSLDTQPPGDIHSIQGNVFRILKNQPGEKC